MPTADLMTRSPTSPWSLLRQLRRRTIQRRDPSIGSEYIDIRVETKNAERRLVGCLVDAHLQDGDLDLLTGLQDLSSLSLLLFAIPTSSQITDAGLIHLRRLRRLTDLSLDGCRNVTDAGIETISALRGLRTLALDHMEQITDAALVHLKALRNLRGLTLDRSSITGAGLRNLAGMPRLRQLSLYASPIHDDALPNLGLCPALRTLNLGGTNVPITDAGLASLEACSRLESLWLWNNRTIHGAALKHLACLPDLKELWLRWTAIEEKHLAHLAAFPRLEVLDLSHTRLTNRAVDHLIGLTNLRALHLAEAKVSGSAVRRLSCLKKLEYLTVGDRVNPDDIRFLRRALPKFKCG